MSSTYGYKYNDIAFQSTGADLSLQSMKPFASLISLVFHPLLILTYMLVLMLVVNPYVFGYNRISDAHTLILMVALTSALIPVIAILVMKGIGWVRTLEMSDRHERIGPYLVTAVLYLSLYLHLVKAKSFPAPLLIATLGAVLALFAGFFLNNFRKISMHAIGVGGFLTLTVILYVSFTTDQFVLPVPFLLDILTPTIVIVYVAILVAGLVCSARLISGTHTPAEVYVGFFTGVLSMLVACLVLA
jgi:hypothetical protein